MHETATICVAPGTEYVNLGSMKIAVRELRRKVVATLAQSFAAHEAERIADYLLWAEMSGIKTQGIVKLTGTEPLQNIKPQHPIRVERDTKLSRLLNAGGGPAPLVSQIAVDDVIGKAIASAYCDYETGDKEWGSTFIAIDPELLVAREEFKNNCSELIEKIRLSRRKDGVSHIRLPGDRARVSYNQAKESGLVDSDEDVLQQLGYI